MKKIVIVIISLIVLSSICLGIYYKMSYTYKTYIISKFEKSKKTETIWASNDSIACAKALKELLFSLRVSSHVYEELGHASLIYKIELIDFMGNDVFKKLEKLTLLRCADNLKRENEKNFGEFPKNISDRYGIIVLDELNK